MAPTNLHEEIRVQRIRYDEQLFRGIVKGTTVTIANPGLAMWWGAFVGGALVGIACMVIKKKKARLKSLAVLPEFRGKGLASKLLEARIAEGRRWKVTYFDAYCAPGSQGIYQRYGFKLRKRIKRPDRETWWMEREFDEASN